VASRSTTRPFTEWVERYSLELLERLNLRNWPSTEKSTSVFSTKSSFSFFAKLLREIVIP
jgi:hypothetical protein